MNSESLWAEHQHAWRDPAQITSWWDEANRTDPALLKHRVRGEFWEAVEASGQTLVVSREYEHLLMALSVVHGRPRVTYLPVPHPSGIAWDSAQDVLHVASTRNPNQVIQLQAVKALDRMPVTSVFGQSTLIPTQTSFYRGSLYLHDLAFIGGVLCGNAVSMNAVVDFPGLSRVREVWRPRCIQDADTALNTLQLNSIAAGPTLAESFFSASVAMPGRRRPGHLDFKVDRQGVVFAGDTGEPIVGGLTRPHSARLHQGRLWVDNSGYGELVVRRGSEYDVVARLPGWTRGLGFAGDVAFVGTSRIIPRFARYAPGVRADKAVCGLHAVSLTTGKVLGSLIWPSGNQIFAIEPISTAKVAGLPFKVGRKPGAAEKRLFHKFIIHPD